MLRYCLPILLFVFSTAFCADVTADLAIARERAGFSADDINAWAAQQHDYHLGSDDIVRMRDAGVPDDVIKTLIDRALPEAPAAPAIDPLSHPTPPEGYDGWWNPDREKIGTEYDITVPAEYVTYDMCEGNPNVICTHEQKYIDDSSVYSGYGDMNSANEIGIATHPLVGRGVIAEYWTSGTVCEPLPVVEFTEEPCESCSSCSRE